MSIKWNRLRKAIAILDGIPKERFKLNIIVDSWSRDHGIKPCGAIGCGIGFISMHPKFQKLGAGYDSRGLLTWKGSFIEDYEDIACELFGLTRDSAYSLFCAVGDSQYDDAAAGASQSREVFRHRVIEFFKEHDQPINSDYIYEF